MNEPSRPHPRIGLALSGGGARSYAQVGALKALEEEGFIVEAIAANSSAAVLGAVYAAKRDAAELERIARAIDFSSFLDADGSAGLIGHDGVSNFLAAHAPDTFEELLVPLAVPAVDIERAELLIFDEGPLRPAVCASNAFPGLFTPVEHQGRFLMDGGMINNFPVDVIQTMTNRPVLGIDVRPSADAPLDLRDRTSGSLMGRIGALFGQGVPTTVDILVKAYNITQSRLVEILCAMHPPDVWFRPDLPYDLDIQDFSRTDEAFEVGYRSLKEAARTGRLDALSREDGDDEGVPPRT